MNRTAHGGSLRKKRNGRGRRPIAIKTSMHLVLRSTQARGANSFRKPHNAKKITEILQKFSAKYSVLMISQANVGNHLHLHLQFVSRRSYNAFIRAVTGAIAQAVMKASRLKWLAKKFWDQRPFTRIVRGQRDHQTVERYIHENQLEGLGLTRAMAKATILEAIERGAYIISSAAS